MIASIFVYAGYGTARDPGPAVKRAEPIALPIAEKVPVLPNDTETLVRINGAVQAGAGVLFALGKFRRLSALALLGSIIPTTLAGHRFWEEDDEATRRQQMIHFLKNLGIVGALVLALVDTEGAPSLGWRARRKAARAGAALDAGRKAGKAAKTGLKVEAGAKAAKAGAKAAKAGAAVHAGREGAGALISKATDALPVG